MRVDRRRFALTSFLSLAGIATLIAGCASAPAASDPSSMTCRELAVEAAGTRQAKAQALAKQQDPFKFVIPFAVAGHHVAAQSAVGDADRWLAELDAQSHRLGCTRIG